MLFFDDSPSAMDYHQKIDFNSNVKINSAMQVVNVPVTAGAKTVTVKIDGKSYTSKVTVK